MELSLHTSQPFPSSRKKAKRVGRGHGSAHGTYSTRGMKGQRSRSGGKSGLRRKGLAPIIRQIPKLRGFQSIHPKATAINVGALEKAFQNGAVVSPDTLVRIGLAQIRHGRKPIIKILGTGDLQKKLMVRGCEVSASAREKIEKAGGEVK